MADHPDGFRGLPRGVWALGLVSMFMDISSELVHSLLPLFMATVLGASMATIGIIEGVAEATAAITKVFSGAVSDYLKKRKLLAVLGYGLAAVTKPVFPLASSIGWVFAARFIDRVGKGIRGAPRDALVADITPPALRGAAFGLRQALDSAGAFLGPLLAVLLMFALAGDMRAVLWVAVVPACVAVIVLVLGVREGPSSASTAGRPLRLADAKRLSKRFWRVVVLGAVFALARFSEAFLILRAHDVGLALELAPVVLVVMNIVYAAVAYPAGVMSDRINARNVVALGLVVLILADVALALAWSPVLVLVGAALWGAHMGMTQGIFAKLVADTAAADLRGTAFGVFNCVNGLALLLASTVAGISWTLWGAMATFAAGGVFAVIALLGLLSYRGPTAVPRVSAERSKF